VVRNSPLYNTEDVIVVFWYKFTRQYFYYVKKIIVAFVLVCSVTVLFAQNTKTSKDTRRAEKRDRINALVKQEEEGVLIYEKQSACGIQLRTDGYAFFYEIGRMKSPRFANLYSLEFSEIKHPKEERFQNAENFFSNSFIYGKRANFYQFKLGYGQQYIIGQKGNKNGIAVLGILNGGLSVGLEKPYYLEVQTAEGNVKDIKYEDYSTLFLSLGSIIGSSGFSKGLNELTVNPGAFLKAALRFDFGHFNESIQAIEIGISAEVYSKEVQQMVLNSGKNVFVQGHLAFLFGRRK
jgi:hypothetical protein